MTRDELLKNHEAICQEARNLMELKNKDYAGNGGLEPFANFTRCEAMGVCTTEQGFLVRIDRDWETIHLLSFSIPVLLFKITIIHFLC